MAMVFVQKSLDGLVLRDHQIVALTDAAESREQRQKLIIEGIADFRKKARIKKPKVSVCIPRNEVLFQQVRLPVAAKENLRQVLDYELERYIPFAPDEVYYDFQVLKEEQDSVHVLLVTARKELIRAYLDTLSLADCQPVSVEVTTSALFNAFAYSEAASAKGAQALIRPSREGGELILIAGGRLAYSHPFRWKEGAASSVSQVKMELQQALLHLSNEDPITAQDVTREGLTCTVLNGSHTSEEMDRFAAESGLPLTMGLKPLRLKGMPADFAPLAAAYGTALKGLKKVSLSVNLLPQERRKQLKRPSIVPTVILVISVAGLGLAWGSIIVARERQQLRDLTTQVEKLNPEIAAAEKMEKESGQIRKSTGALEQIRGEDPSQLEVLKELTALIPENTWLNRFTYSKGKVQIEGEAPSASDLIPILERSSLFQDAKFPAPITKTPEGQERFKIEVAIEKNVPGDGSPDHHPKGK